MILNYAIVALFSSGLVLGCLYLHSRLSYWRDAYYNRDEDFKEIMNRAILAERESARIVQDIEFQKRTLSLIARRDSVAILTDAQVQHVVQSLAQLIMSQTKAPSQMN